MRALKAQQGLFEIAPTPDLRWRTEAGKADNGLRRPETINGTTSKQAASVSQLGDFINTFYNTTMIKNQSISDSTRIKLHRDYATNSRLFSSFHSDMTVGVNHMKQAAKTSCTDVAGCSNPRILKSALEKQHVQIKTAAGFDLSQ